MTTTSDSSDTPTTPEWDPESQTCPECGSRRIERDLRGETVCANCGLVLDAHSIDFGPEWRSFEALEGQGKERAGAPLTEALHDYGLSTVVGKGSKDAHGKRVAESVNSTMRRLRRLQNRVVMNAGGGRSLATAITEILRIATALDIPRRVAERGIRIYREASQKHLVRGRSIEGVAAASLYAACRLEGIPRTPDQIGEVGKVDRRTLLRIHRLLVHELKLKAPPPSGKDYIPRIASALRLSPKVESRAREILEIASKEGLESGRSPVSLAAAALYIASHELGEPRVQRVVSEAAGISEVTLRARSKELVGELGLTFPA